jgi:hypothetical protein
MVLQGNTQRETNSVGNDQNDDSGFFFETMEKSVHGECQTYYTVSQTGPFQSAFQREAQGYPQGKQSSEETPRQAQKYASAVDESSEEQNQELPWPAAFNQYCRSGDQVYEIMKVTNFTACKNKPVLSYFSPAEVLNCRPGDNTCGSILNRALVSRILACGTSRRDFNILQINQEEQFNFGLRDEQRIVAVGVKNITIEKINKGGSSSVHYSLTNPQSVDLVYEFSRREQRQQVNGKNQQATYTNTMQSNGQQQNHGYTSGKRQHTSYPWNHKEQRYSQSSQEHQSCK